MMPSIRSTTSPSLQQERDSSLQNLLRLNLEDSPVTTTMSRSASVAQSTPRRKYTNKLHNKHVLIFGGTSAIGFCIAEACLEHGAQVTISGSNQARLNQALSRLRNSYPDIPSPNLKGYTCDLCPADTYNTLNTNYPNTKTPSSPLETNLIQLLNQATAQKSRPLHHIAFAAGDSLRVTAFRDLTVPTILQSGTVRFLAPILLAKLAPAYFAPPPPPSPSPDSSSSSSPYSPSITLTSGMNAQKPMPNWTVLAAYSAAIEGLTRGLAIDLKPIRVNVVSPGPVLTELFNALPADRRDATLEAVRKGTVLKRLGRPGEVAEAYLYAMRDGFCTGQVLASDGGRLLV